MDSIRTQRLEHRLNQLASESLQIPLSKELLDKLDQALTHVSAGQHKNFEQLEFLDDAVLRLAPWAECMFCSTLRIPPICSAAPIG